MCHSDGGSAQVFEWAADGQDVGRGGELHRRDDLYDRRPPPPSPVELGEGGDVYDLSFSPDGTMLAAARGGGGLTVVDTRDWQPVHDTATMHADRPATSSGCPTATRSCPAGATRSVSLYDVRRDLVRAQACRHPTSAVDGCTFLLPDPNDELVVLQRGRAGTPLPPRSRPAGSPRPARSPGGT